MGWIYAVPTKIIATINIEGEGDFCGKLWVTNTLYTGPSVASLSWMGHLIFDFVLVKLTIDTGLTY